MVASVFIGVIFAVILYCLLSAAYYLSQKKREIAFAKILTWRIILALALFLFLWIAFYMGWIQPHGIVR